MRRDLDRAKISVKLSGEFALFTRPEGKVERTSYPLLTPSAARGALEAIMWKPEIMFDVRRIKVLKKLQFYSIVRNEVENKASIGKAFMEHPRDVFTDDMRQLRHSLILQDVSYIVEADIVLRPECQHPVQKYVAMFKRRLAKGQCFYQPYLGTREFSARFEEPIGREKPIDWTDYLGTLFYDFRYPQKGASGSVTIPYFFNAHIEKGVMEIPKYLFEEVNRSCM